jgi:uncharacterized protein (DUF488 family)
LSGTVYTIGCSAHPIEHFIQLLKLHAIAAVADVRSVPYSRLHPQFNREPVSAVLKNSGIDYIFLGKELGARSDDPNCYVNGKVQYDRIAATDLFKQGLERLERDMQARRIAIMCAEKEPFQCHRTILVSRRLAERGVEVIHILADGALETHAAVMSRLLKKLHIPEDDLFRSHEEVYEEAYRIQGQAIAFAPPSEEAD